MSQPQGPDSQLFSMPDFHDLDDDDQNSLLQTQARPPFWRRRRTLVALSILLLLILLGAGLFALLGNRRQVTTYRYQRVVQGDFALTVSATGPLQTGIYNVVFSGTGRIAEIDVKVGQTVKKGQVLAKLDKTSLQDAVNQAQAAVLAAAATLNSNDANLSKAQALAQANVKAAQTALSNAQAGLTAAQASAQASIQAAQTTLSDAQANLVQTQRQAQASIAAAQTALDNARANLAAVQNQAQKSIAVAFNQEQQAINTCNTEATPPPDCVELAEAQYNQAVANADATVVTAQNQVDTAQKSLVTAQTQGNANITTAQGQVNAAQQSLNTAMTQGNQSVTTALGQVSTAQQQLNTAEAQAAANVTTALGQVSTAQQQFNTAQTQLQTAQHNLENATLTAPHDGIVSLINGTVGGTPGTASNASAATTAGGGTFIQIIDTSVLQVVANVNESDIGNVKLGQPAQFTVSAYGQRIFHGTVSAISPNGQTVSNVVTYPVTIDVDTRNLNVSLLPNMTANVTITVVQQTNVLLIPVSAINFARTATSATNGSPALITRDDANVALDEARTNLRELENSKPDITSQNPIPAYVIEQSGKQFIAKPVVLGLTDETVYVVLAGLSAGETIVVGAQRGG